MRGEGEPLGWGEGMDWTGCFGRRVGADAFAGCSALLRSGTALRCCVARLLAAGRGRSSHQRPRLLL